MLPAPSEWEEILRDYRQLGLSTGRHPLALLRPQIATNWAFCRRRTWIRSTSGRRRVRRWTGDSPAASADGQGRDIRVARG